MIKHMDTRNVTPEQGWFIPLIGHEFDLAYWEQQFKRPFEPWCERIVVRETFCCVLRSARFTSAQTAAEVRECAIPFVAQLNGIMASAIDAKPLTFQDVGFVDDFGGVQIASFATGTSIARAMATATLTVDGPDGHLKPPPPPEPSVAQNWARVAKANGDIATMLDFAGRSDNWFDILKTVELAEGVVGGEKKMPAFLGVSSTRYSKFCESMNYHRHAPKKGETRKNLLTLSEAQSFLRAIVRAVLAKPVN